MMLTIVRDICRHDVYADLIAHYGGKHEGGWASADGAS